MTFQFKIVLHSEFCPNTEFNILEFLNFFESIRFSKIKFDVLTPCQSRAIGRICQQSRTYIKKKQLSKFKSENLDYKKLRCRKFIIWIFTHPVFHRPITPYFTDLSSAFFVLLLSLVYVRCFNSTKVYTEGRCRVNFSKRTFFKLFWKRLTEDCQNILKSIGIWNFP